uniref:Arrestin, beta 2b n=1 Tax=Neogobius melanostomus TaxID=47308 RepID=A0A8C6U5Y2_9GOBI
THCNDFIKKRKGRLISPLIINHIRYRIIQECRLFIIISLLSRYCLFCVVFVNLTCAFRYGREDLDVLGLSFRKVLFNSTVQVFPVPPVCQQNLSQLQEKLVKKLGQHAYPFNFTIPHSLPCSVTLQPGPEDTGKACGVDYELQVFCAMTEDEKIHQRNSVHLLIRKVQYAPEKPGPQPMMETSRNFLMSDRILHLEASLDKELYYHGEPININVHVTNNSTKTVKKIKVSALTCNVSLSRDQVSPSSTLCKIYTLTPVLGPNREKRGLALDGKLKHEDTNLASSTMYELHTDMFIALLCSYLPMVLLMEGAVYCMDVAVELPFVLMHPKPKEEAHTPPTHPGKLPRIRTEIAARRCGL